MRRPTRSGVQQRPRCPCTTPNADGGTDCNRQNQGPSILGHRIERRPTKGTPPQCPRCGNCTTAPSPRAPEVGRGGLWRDEVEVGAGGMSRAADVAAMDLGTNVCGEAPRGCSRSSERRGSQGGPGVPGVWVSELRWRFGFNYGVLPPLLFIPSPDASFSPVASRVTSLCSWRGSPSWPISINHGPWVATVPTVQ